MELTKPIYEALLRLETFEQLQGFLRVATIKGTKQSKFKIYDYTVSEELRPTISGVYHDPEAQKAVATDAHVLIVSGADYKEELAGQIIGKTGNVIDGKFPNWRAVVPKVSANTPLFDIDEALMGQIAKFKATHKKSCKTIKEHNEKFKAIVKHVFDNSGSGSLSIQTDTIGFSPQMLQRFIKGARYIGATHVGWIAPDRPIIATADNGDMVLCMPIVLTDDLEATTHTEFDGDIDKPFIAFINDLD